MGALRDFFAKGGFCESTADIEAKPRLVFQLAEQSLEKMGTHSSPRSQKYEARLRSVLFDATSYSLHTMLEQGVAVVLDQRFAQQKMGFFDSELYAGFYNDGRQKILGIYDLGKPLSQTGFFERDASHFGGQVIDKLVNDFLEAGKAPSRILGRTYFNPASKSSSFEWRDWEDFTGELKKNPHLALPPHAPNFL